jgi:hypothetical protein
MEANGRLGKEAQKLLIALSCAIVRMENKHPEGTDAFRFAASPFVLRETYALLR